MRAFARSPRTDVVTALSLAASLCAIGACVDFVPGEGTRIECKSKAQCPDGWSCEAGIARCVPPGSEHTAPKVDDVAIDPAVAGAGARVTLSFLVDEALFADPVVKLAGEHAFTLDEDATDRDERRYAFTYTVVGDEIEGEATLGVEAKLTDRLGNTATTRVEDLELDFKAPENPSLTLDVDGPGDATADAHATAGDAATVCFDGDVLEAADCDDEASFVAVSDLVTLTFTAGSGEKTVRATFEDDAGNRSEPAERTHTFVEGGAVESHPALALPDAQSALKNGDVVTIGGAVTAGATV